MIQPLRKVQGRVFGVLAVVLPAILFFGIERRHPRPQVPATAEPVPGILVKASDGLWRKHAIRTELYRDAQNTYVVLRPAEDLGEPDLLLYWAGSISDENALPAEARLLGSFNPSKAFALRNEDRAGSLVLYSLAHQRVVDTATLEKMP